MRTRIMRDASYLLPPPGGEVVRYLLDSYDALLARHNALVEAVTILQKLDMGRGRSLTMVEVGLLIDARAEVDRLLLGES